MRSKSGSKPKPKRNFKSISSNPSSSSGNSDGKKPAKLGMAWGASSRSSTRSAFRNSPFPEFGSYMVVKNQKLHQQFNAAAASSSNESDSGHIFSGVSIFVDGYTVPPSQELRGYMLKHGGRFENYFSRRLVTHIICSNLPDSKIKNLRVFSGGLPVVKPAWILDSIAANKLLSWIPYQLDQLVTENHNQPKLSDFFTSKDSGAREIENDHTDSISNQPLNNLSSSNQSLDQADGCNIKQGVFFQVDSNRLISEEPSCFAESSSEVKSVEISDCLHLDGENSYLEHISSKCHSSLSPCSNSVDNHKADEASTTRIDVPTNQQHSTLSDPNFVENYFKSSRLHFIGTWRNRYRKRYPRSSNEHNYERSGANTSRINETFVVHIDMDCFFVSVVIKDHPELLDKPVAVCHSDSSRGTAEISSANYTARDYGVKAGMFVKEAKSKCPELVIVPYNFEAYEMVADQFYDVLHKHCNKVQAVSCDEAFLDVTESDVGDPQLLASIIRKEIFDTTGCTASAGIAGNMLMARLATRTAKPNGQCYIPSEKVENYLCTLPVKALPGIGHVLEEKLKKKQIETCGQLHLISKESLQKDFGMKTGEMLWNYSRGIDNRLVGVIQECKSIGADVNWGVRFRNSNDCQHFLANLCKEVALRLHGCGVQGRSFTLKLKKKRSDAIEPVKYLGHGDCENMSHSITIPMATNDVDVLQRLASQLFGHFQIDVKDIRGVGLQVSKLEGANDGKSAHKKNSILPWLVSVSPNVADHKHTGDLHKHSETDSRGSSGSALGASSESGVPRTTTLPPLQDLDMAVIEDLPPDVVSEINEMYGGKLLVFISENKGRSVNTNVRTASTISDEGATVMDIESLPGTNLVESNNEVIQSGVEEPPMLAVADPFCVENIMPSSLSQIDYSVLQQLPDELRKDIIDLLPHHREREIVEQTEIASSDFDDLWDGNPPTWVEKFKAVNDSFLSYLAEVYQSRSSGSLSSVLQRMMSGNFPPLVMGTGGIDVVGWLCELLKQYIDLKITTDMEEIYACMCLLKRLTARFEYFSQVFDIILPRLQALMGEKYGGTLSIPCL